MEWWQVLLIVLGGIVAVFIVSVLASLFIAKFIQVGKGPRD